MSNSITRRFRLLGTAVLVAALSAAVFMSGGVSAQGNQRTAPVVVSNMDESTHRVFYLAYTVGNRPSSYSHYPSTVLEADRQAAVGFTTGSHEHGYQLTKIKIRATSGASQAAPSVPKAAIYSDLQGRPYRLVGTLTGPGSTIVSTSPNDSEIVFTAGGDGIHTDANTSYHVVVTNDVPSTAVAYFLWNATRSDDDSDFASPIVPRSGWTVADVGQNRHGDSGTWANDSGGATFKLQISAKDAPPSGVFIDGNSRQEGSQSQSQLTEGTPSSYTVKLTNAPDDNATVTITASSSSDELRLSNSTLTFNSTNYATPQLVTMEALDDNDGVNDVVTVSHSVAGFGEVTTAKPLTVTIVDDDTVGRFTMDLIDQWGNYGSLRMNEGGEAFLRVIPEIVTPNTVTVSAVLSPDSPNIYLTQSSFEVAPNTDTPGAFSIRSNADADSQPETVTLTLSATEANGGTLYNLPNFASFEVFVNDLDALEFSDIDTDVITYVREGMSKVFGVRPAGAPVASVVVTIVPDIDLEMTVDTDLQTDGNQNTLTFTSANWETYQNVTIASPNDDDGFSTIGVVSFSMSGAPYDGDVVTLNFIGEDTKKEWIHIDLEDVSDGVYAASVTEGEPFAFGMKLNSSPYPSSEDVTVVFEVVPPSELTVKSGDETSGSGTTTLTFTSDNWNTAQTVTMFAPNDLGFDGATATVTFTSSGADYTFLPFTIGVTIEDDDEPGLVLSSETIPMVETLDGATGGYALSLLSGPASDVTVTVTQPANRYVEIDTDPDTDGIQTTITFTPMDWHTPHRVAVTLYADHDALDATASILNTASGGGYDGQTATVTVSIDDQFECPPPR